MLFNSWKFIFIFLPTSLFIYFYLNKKKATELSKVWLIIISLFFYGSYNISYIPLILTSIILNYLIGTTLVASELTVESAKSNFFYKFQRIFGRYSIIVTGISVNLLLLGYLKYVNFFIENINILFDLKVQLVHILLPLGISFFTFQQISFLVDSYKGRAKKYSLLNYSLFVTFFPYLLSGPIVYHQETITQYENDKKKLQDYKNIAIGLFLFSVGLFKKVVLADTLAIYANDGFNQTQVLTLISAWITSLSYTFQIYFDFSGYTDMALGTAWMFNIHLPLNFNSPYKATSIREFWQRWHMTLTRFLRDYIYISLGGNRSGKLKTLRNIIITFLLCGFWHGAAWNFIFWGLLHGLAMVVNRIWGYLNVKLNSIISWILTFSFVNISWVFFRAQSWEDALNILKAMLGINGCVIPKSLEGTLFFFKQHGFSFGNVMPFGGNTVLISFLCVLLLFFILLLNNSGDMATNFQPNWKYVTYTAILFSLSFVNMLAVNNKKSIFLYFNF